MSVGMDALTPWNAQEGRTQSTSTVTKQHSHSLVDFFTLVDFSCIADNHRPVLGSLIKPIPSCYW
jgi:hypothetical protein